MARLGMIIDGGWPDRNKRPAEWRTEELKEWKRKQAFPNRLARRIKIRLQIQALEKELEQI